MPLKTLPSSSYLVLYFVHNDVISGENHLGSLTNRIGGVMVSVLSSSAVDRGFEPQSDKTKDDEIGMCCFVAKHAALRS